MISRTLRGRRAALALSAALALVVAACGNDDSTASSDEDPAGGDATADAAVVDDIVADAEERLERWYEGTYGSLPDEAPEPEPGRNIWVISCGQAAEGCQVPSDAAAEAGEAIGWDVTVYDAQLDPTRFESGVRQATAAGADAVILAAVDCFLAKQAIEEAKSEGVLVFGVLSLDCDDPNVGGEPLFDGDLSFGEMADYATLAQSFGAAKADWIISKTGGKTTTIAFRHDELLAVKHINDGFDKRMAECDSCEVVTVEFTLADLGPALQQKAQQSLLQYPEANAVMVPYDSALTLGVEAAVVEAQRGDELVVMGGEGFRTNFEAVRQGGGQDAGVGYGFEWAGYAAVDGLNRLFHAEEVVDTGNGLAVWDEEHNMDDNERYSPPVDFKAGFREIWGVSS